MSEKIDHEEAWRIAEAFLATPDHVNEDQMDKLPAAYLDLRAKALAYLDSQKMEQGQWEDLEADLMKCSNARAALLACLERVMENPESIAHPPEGWDAVGFREVIECQRCGFEMGAIHIETKGKTTCACCSNSPMRAALMELSLGDGHACYTGDCAHTLRASCEEVLRAYVKECGEIARRAVGVLND